MSRSTSCHVRTATSCQRRFKVSLSSFFATASACARVSSHRILQLAPLVQCEAFASRENCSLVLVSFHAIMCLTMRLCFFADSCTLLDAFGGSLLGRQCPTMKSVGPNDGVFFGGQRFDVKVLSPWCYVHSLSYIYTHTYMYINTHLCNYISGFIFNMLLQRYCNCTS